MRDLRRQQQIVWWCKITDNVEISYTDEETGEEIFTGEYKKVISNPIKMKMTLNPTLGNASFSPYGLTQDTRREMTTCNMDLDISIGDLFFVDRKPKRNKDGSLVIAKDGINYVTPPDYYVNSVMKSEKGTVARYGITRSE